MSTVFIPKMIRTAEEAEALPVDTVATHHRYMPVRKWKPRGEDPIWGYYGEPVDPEDLIGWTAFVPIVARDEWASAAAWESWDCDAVHGKRAGAETDAERKGDPRIVRRYVTEWKDA